MARDYSHRRGNAPKKRRRAAKPARNTRSSKNSGMPGWVLVFAGLSVGLAFAAGVYIYYKPLDNGQTDKVPPAAQQGNDKPDRDANGLPPKEPGRFAFYEMLPNYEIVIQYEDEKKPAGTQPDDNKPKAAVTPDKVDEPGRYLVQAGSFKTYADADKRKARMALLGVESEIEKVTIDSTTTWYRVRVGPEKNLSKVNEILKTLRDNGIESLLMRYKG